MLIVQGNRFGGMLALHVGSGCVASGDAHLTSLIQPLGSKIHPSFVDLISYTETHWALYRQDDDPQHLGLMLGLEPTDVMRLKSSPLFGTIRCVKGPSRKLPWALDVHLAADNARVASMVDLLRAALTDEHLYYVFCVEFRGFAESDGEVGRPTLEQFKTGSPHYVSWVDFTLKSERHPSQGVRVEIDGAQPGAPADALSPRARVPSAAKRPRRG